MCLPKPPKMRHAPIYFTHPPFSGYTGAMAKKQMCAPAAPKGRTASPDETEQKMRLQWEAARWKNGFKCPACGWQYTREWAIQQNLKPRLFSRYRLNLPSAPLARARGNIVCPACGAHVSATSGTLLGGAKKPPSTIFIAAAVFMKAVDGISAPQLKKAAGMRNLVTTKRYIQRFHRAMSPAPWDLLEGTVQIDEGKISLSPRRGGRYSLPFIIAVEKTNTGAAGRTGLRLSKDPVGLTWHAEAAEMIKPGTTIETRRQPTYEMLAQRGYTLKPVEGAGKTYGTDLLPLCAAAYKQVAAILKKKYRGSVKEEQAQAYLDEIAYRLNRPDLEAATKELLARLLQRPGKKRRGKINREDAMP